LLLRNIKNSPDLATKSLNGNTVYNNHKMISISQGVGRGVKLDPLMLYLDIVQGRSAIPRRGQILWPSDKYSHDCFYLFVAKFIAVFVARGHCWLQGRAPCSVARDWTTASRILQRIWASSTSNGILHGPH